MAEQNGKYIISIDAGSTGIRAILYDRSGAIIRREYEKTPAEHPEPGATEHDPEMLWQALIKTVKAIFADGTVLPSEVAAIGITNQRSSFCIWDKKTGEPLTNFINWQDVRAADSIAKMNRHPVWMLLKGAMKLFSRIINSTLLIATSMLVFNTDHTIGKVRWLLDERPDLDKKCRRGKAVFGTIDTWFIYKLTGGKNHLTDYTNAASTAMFNPFDLKWNDIYCKIFDIPMSMLPEVRDTNGYFGDAVPELFGTAIPIRAAIGDQQSSLFGHGCYKPGDVKCSLGSGSFVCVNVGDKGKVSRRGLFPLVAWVIDGKPTYMLEGQVATTGTLIDWLGQGIGLSDTPVELNELAESCEDSEGVFFVPTPTGIRFPYFVPGAKASLVGLSLKTDKRHVARAVLEGIAMRIQDILEGVESDAKTEITEIMTDGGVSRSDILMQCLADYSGTEVERAPEPDMTATGAAYMAGLSCGFWSDYRDLLGLRQGYTVFKPFISEEQREEKKKKWKDLLKNLLKVNL
ncbi:MAG: FGGY family carbohydrate kinase [Spirochaetales bacterium]|uniref:Glycerol kinase 5 n=1 Tax=Candidatus Thalassospirochaeta sargassi TaxID=3119039 RepID=A0AAJ1MKZ1_9SPIO|nr:FGGY family carbohydrate kinase [Spirochaetales bacterium]